MCKTCGVTFNPSYNIFRQSKYTNLNYRKRITCSKCLMDELPYECDFCTERFLHLKELMDHREIHSNTRNMSHKTHYSGCINS